MKTNNTNSYVNLMTTNNEISDMPTSTTYTVRYDTATGIDDMQAIWNDSSTTDNSVIWQQDNGVTYYKGYYPNGGYTHQPYIWPNGGQTTPITTSATNINRPEFNISEKSFKKSLSVLVKRTFSPGPLFFVTENDINKKKPVEEFNIDSGQWERFIVQENEILMFLDSNTNIATVIFGYKFSSECFKTLSNLLLKYEAETIDVIMPAYRKSKDKYHKAIDTMVTKFNDFLDINCNQSS